MTIFYVGSLARYVLVEANDEFSARVAGRPALHELYADMRQRMGREVPVNIHTVRLATTEEIELWNWHHEMVAKHAANAG